MKFRVFPILLFILAVGVAGAYFLLSPRLVSFSPGDGAQDVLAQTPLRLEFSRPVSAEEALAHVQIEPAVQVAVTVNGPVVELAPQGGWPAGQSVQVRLARGLPAAGFPRLGLRSATAWSFRVSEPRLLFLYPASGAANLYVMQPAANESRPLTSLVGGVLDFWVDAQGQSALLSAVNSAGGTDIVRLALNTEAAEPELVYSCGQAVCQSAQPSPQGNFLAYEQTASTGAGLPGYPQVWLLPLADGAPSGEARLAGQTDHQTVLPLWSSTGRLAFYDTNLSSYVLLDPAGGESLFFANATGEGGAWDPQGNFFIAAEITFAANPQEQAVASSRLMRFNLADSSTQDLTGAENLEDAAPAFSPDGMYLAFARKYLDLTRWTPGRQIWVMRPDGQEATQLSDEPFQNHFDFAWNPAGDQLAYTRFNQTVMTDPPELWVMDLANGQAARLVTGGYAPQWLP